ncbi:YaaA family protein [uncultured Corynebacterium sp.]|uniref:YaaA family protein n=1 Tax=uncultured Corynebacterium sp. TaxID=159447 RepID=UPI0025F37190|nr:peroxide stress protein YaaA [uncultured Corynebacterium sp.]
MLILLPPSETKSSGGSGAPLDLATLSWPQLNDVRAAIAADLTALSADRDAAMAALKLGPKLADEVDANAALFTSPTAPALDRYTGVLFDALDAASLSPAERSRLAIGSALFGVVGGEDMIPKYRLSGGSKIPLDDGSSSGTAPTMRARWGSALTEALVSGDHGLVVDLRSGTYMNLGKVPGAVTATVLTTAGTVVSHFNKHHKGLLARALARTTERVESIDDAVDVARAAGLDARADDGGITVTVPD